MNRPLREARIDLGAITANVARLRELAPAEHTMAVVKANGYGHGALPVAEAALAGGADWLGVVELGEALPLRDAGITAPILTWIHGPDTDFTPAIEHGIDVGVNSIDQLEQVAAAGVARVHLKIDTGLGRNGATLDAAAGLFAAASDLQSRGRVEVVGVFSHLAGADDAAQVAAFEHAIDLAAAAGIHPELRHLAATAGALSLPAARFDMVRLGIGVYGLSPLAGVSSAELGLTPALELSAAIISVKRVPAGSGVSYGHTYVTDRETTLALVPLGYAEGIPRHASGLGPVVINGSRFTVAGRVAMDQFVVDVGDLPVQVGDRAVLFGDPARGLPGAVDWADAIGTIDYEIVTRLGGRIERTYRG